ncbi:outer membrane beta-barrel protein [Longitalea arenae]|uniref:outer membrane beta-barrel protein n=1 Tax=Longitalea arenae TaxID=2812558 RepID=UPI001967F845|nr:outer membrane beta-barrel protein [Longitalea arenae]
MSDHEFEKQVHQKMQELKLRPSDSVWMEVEKNIRLGKRRRRFMWLWMAALFVGVTSSGYFLYHYSWQTASGTEVAEAASMSSSTQKSTESTNSTLPAIHKNNTAAQPATEHVQSSGEGQANASSPQTGSTQPATQDPVTAPQAGEQSSTPNEIPPSPAIIADRRVAAAPLITSPNFTTSQNNKNSIEKPRYRKKKGTGTTSKQQHKPVQQELITFNDVEQSPEAEAPVLNNSLPALVEGPYNSIATNKAAPAPFGSRFTTLPTPDSLSSSKANTVSIPRRKSSLWHWGIVADAGYSRISESKLFQLRGLLGQDKYLAEDLSARSAASVNPSNASPNSLINVTANTMAVRKASAIQPDLAFSAGVFVQRTLSPRLKISLGLEYAFISVNTQVGKRFDSAIDVNIGTSNLKVVPHYYDSPGYIDTMRGGASANYQSQDRNRVFYSQKQRYKFHYIEIPLLLNWQINKGRRLPPIAFEGGVSIGHLISAQALHFEGVKGVYYEDNSLLNKTQFNFVTGLNVGLFQQSKHPVWIGPNLRYALKGLVNKEVSAGQYLWSTGLSVKMMLGRL